MELEKKYLKDIAHHLDEAKWDRFGHQSRIVANGIQESGLLREMSSTRESISRLAAMADYSFDAITRQLVINNQLMSGLLEAVQNPKATAANEMYKSGVEALNSGWVPEAIEDLEEAVTIYRRHAGAYYALGWAYRTEKKYSEAASAFSKAARYNLGHTNHDPERACGAALLGSLAFLAAGQPDEARQLLQEIHEKVPECPDVALAIARRWRADADVYRRALSAAPEFAVEAFSHDLRRGSVDTIEAVSDDLCFGRRGLSGQLERVRASHEQLTKDLKELGGTVPASRLAPALSTSAREETPNAILLAGTGTEMNERVPQLAALVDIVDTQLRQWVSTQQSNLASERSRLDQKEKNYQEAKATRSCLSQSVVLFAIPAILAVVLLDVALSGYSGPDVLNAAVGLGFWVLALVSLVMLIGVIMEAWGALKTIGNFPVSSRERKRLKERQAEIENKQGEIGEHLEAARQVLASWPPKRVVPFF